MPDFLSSGVKNDEECYFPFSEIPYWDVVFLAPSGFFHFSSFVRLLVRSFVVLFSSLFSPQFGEPKGFSFSRGIWFRLTVIGLIR